MIMNKAVRNFLFRVAILTLIVVGTSFVLFQTVIPEHYLNIFPFVLFFLIVVTLLSFYVLYGCQKKNIAKYSNRLMLVIMLKMFAILTFIITYALAKPENAVTFVSGFFGAYLLYTIILNKSLVELNNSK